MSDILQTAIDKTNSCGVTNIRGPLQLKHGDLCEGCRQVARNVVRIQACPVKWSGNAYEYAFNAGWQASVDNKTKSDCPYCLRSGRSQQFANAWHTGYEAQILAVLRGQYK